MRHCDENDEHKIEEMKNTSLSTSGLALKKRWAATLPQDTERERRIRGWIGRAKEGDDVSI